ncbi:hypothetical protein BDV18DRAFT_138274 [Aspergillus unguis]
MMPRRPPKPALLIRRGIRTKRTGSMMVMAMMLMMARRRMRAMMLMVMMSPWTRRSITTRTSKGRVSVPPGPVWTVYSAWWWEGGVFVGGAVSVMVRSMMVVVMWWRAGRVSRLVMRFVVVMRE